MFKDWKVLGVLWEADYNIKYARQSRPNWEGEIWAKIWKNGGVNQSSEG